MARNTLGDLQNIIFEELERVLEASPEEVEMELKRGGVVSKLASNAISNANTMLDAARLREEQAEGARLDRMLTSG